MTTRAHVQKSYLIQTHKYRGFATAADMIFARVLVVGWVTIGIYHGAILDRMRRITNVLSNLEHNAGEAAE
jgi:uncharacterized membrane protein YciS (DUF1049 family)